MMAHQSARELHDLDEIHLVAIRRLAWVLPDEQGATVGQPIARGDTSARSRWVDGARS
jgi:hypothetical protein